MSRRLLLALLAPLLAAASAAAISTAAHAHYRPPHYQACVTAKRFTWLYSCYGCRSPVYLGRPFRVEGQDRGQLLVRNRQMWGWVNRSDLRLADDHDCWEAGI